MMRSASLLLVTFVFGAALTASALECGKVFDGPSQQDQSVVFHGRTFSPSWSGFHTPDEESQLRKEWAVVSSRAAARMIERFDGSSCATTVDHEPDVIPWTRHTAQAPSADELSPGTYHTMVRFTKSNGEIMYGMSNGFQVRASPSGVCVDAGICKSRWERATPGSGFVTNYSGRSYQRTGPPGTGIGDDQSSGVGAFSSFSDGAELEGGSGFFVPGEEFADIIEDENDDNLSGGQIAGITIGVVLAVLLIILIIVIAVTGGGGQQRFTGSAPNSGGNIDSA